jgi:hypothetical protein
VPLPPSARDIPIQVEGEACGGRPLQRFDHATVTEESDRILVNTYLHQAARKSCSAGTGLLIPASVHLATPLGSRSIFDLAGTIRAEFERPILRWPGDSEWDCLRGLPQFRDIPETDDRPQVSPQLVYSFKSATLANPTVMEKCNI